LSFSRYFEIIDDCIETFFYQTLDYPFERLHPKNGAPTAAI